MDPDHLFLAVVSDLKRLLGAGDDYSMLRASALLRQLLMDGHSSLVHVVNRRRRVPFRFAVAGRRYAEALLASRPVFYIALSGIHPGTGPPLPVEQVKLDAFLKTKVLALGPNVLTIGDLISISANVLGGVHSGDPKDEKEQALAHFSQHVAPPGQNVNAAQMMPVILVVLDALAPVVGAVERDLAARENAPNA